LIFAYHNHQQWLNKSEFIKA